MGRIILIVLGFYILVGLAAGGGAVYGLASRQPPRAYACADNNLALAAGTAPNGTTGSPQTLPILAVRSLIWPWSLWQAMQAGTSAADWLILHYDYAPDACHWGPGGQMPYPRQRASEPSRPP